MESVSALGFLVAGVLLGVRHAFDADHLAAVASLLAGEFRLRRAWLVGAVWRLGHTLALLVAAAVVMLVGTQIPERLALAFEFVVALMLVALGLRVFWRLARGGRLHIHPHRHGSVVHAHPHLHDAGDVHMASPGAPSHWHDRGLRFFFVGLVHGMAGSAALLLIAVVNTPSVWQGMLYVVMFGLGSVGGMLAMSTVMSVPLATTARRLPRLNAIV